MKFANVNNLRLEYKEWGHNADKKPIVLMHEGLGCITMWREFPQVLAKWTNRRVIAFSRPGYGNSQNYPEPRRTNYLHREAQETLPAFLEFLNIENPVILGHSDGGSITLIYAATFPQKLSAAIVMAPHEFHEPMMKTSLEDAVRQFKTTHWRRGLAKHHKDAVRVFEEWSGVWLSDEHKNWNIVADLKKTTVPLLAIQGRQDEYASLKQIEVIAEEAPQTRLLVLDSCRHSPQFDARDRVLGAIAAFLENIS